MKSISFPQAAHTISPDGETEGCLLFDDAIQDCDQEAATLMGCARDALVGSPASLLWQAEQPRASNPEQAFRERIAAAHAGLPQTFRWHLRRGDASAFEALVELESMVHDGRTAILMRIRALHQRSDRADTLAQDAAGLRQILDNSSVAIFVKNSAGRYLFANRRYCEFFGAGAGDIVGRHESEIEPAEVLQGFHANDLIVLKARAPRDFEEIVDLGEGPRVLLSTKFPLFDTHGEPYAVCGIATDITERKRTEDALRRVAIAVSEAEGDAVFQELTRHLTEALGVECAFVAMCKTPSNDQVRTLAVYSDGGLEENVEYALRGTVCGTVVGQQFRFLPSGVRQVYPADPMFNRLSIEGYAAYPVSDSTGNPLGLIAAMSRRPLKEPRLAEALLKIFAARASSEIERKVAEESLRASEEQYREIFAASVDGMVMLNAAGEVVDANPAYLGLFGCTREQLVGIGGHALTGSESPASCDDLWQAASSGQAFHRECRAQRYNGEAIDIEVRGVQMHYQGQPHLLCIVRDITARKRADSERVRLEAQLRQAQKMEAIGQLTGGIAHDFNNILTSIMGYVVLAAEREEELGDARLGKYLEQARLASTRARDLILKMLTFSRGQRGERELLSLAPLVKESVKLLRSTMPATIELETELAGDVPLVQVDPVQLQQVLLNLCINARDALSGAGTIRVSLSIGETDAICTSCRTHVQGHTVALVVSDTGSGISPEVMERMFEPFFSTKEVGKGSGMGLSTVHGIVHEHGGHIVVESRPGKGATFRVLFPPVAEAIPEIAPSRPRSVQRRARIKLSGHVLVVDDEETVAAFMHELLQGWGLQVTIRHSAIEARDLILRDPTAFGLILLDQTMPKLTGLEFAAELSARCPEVPVILYSGYSESLSAEELDRAHVRALMRKPIEPDVLLQLLQTHLRVAAVASKKSAAGAS